MKKKKFLIIMALFLCIFKIGHARPEKEELKKEGPDKASTQPGSNPEILRPEDTTLPQQVIVSLVAQVVKDMHFPGINNVKNKIKNLIEEGVSLRVKRGSSDNQGEGQIPKEYSNWLKKGEEDFSMDRRVGPAPASRVNAETQTDSSIISKEEESAPIKDKKQYTKN